ncbi:MAG: site-2 protease family protein [Actinomycetota bacterium]
MAAQTQVPALRFRLFGIPVEVHGAFFLIVALLGWTGDFADLVVWMAIAFVSILLHELGHAVAARRFGSPTSVVLYGFGGLTSHHPTTTARDLVVTLAGPAAGLIAGGLVYVGAEIAEPLHGEVRTAALYALWINVGWGIVNLLPILPLDGGNALRSVIKLVTGVDRETLVRKVSIAVALIGAVIALKAGLFFAALLAVFFVGENLKGLRDDARTGQLRRLVDAAPGLAHNDTAAVLAAADEVLAQRPYPDVAATALQVKAWAHLGRHDVAAARAAVDALPTGHHPSLHLVGVLALAEGDTDRGLAFVVEGFLNGAPSVPQTLADEVLRDGCLDALDARIALLDPSVAQPAVALLHAGLHHAGHYRAAVDYGTVAYASPNARRELIAYNIACSLARLHQSDQALEWLATAFRDGFADAATVDTDDDLVALRAEPGFAAVRALLAG